MCNPNISTFHLQFALDIIPNDYCDRKKKETISSCNLLLLELN